MVIVTIIRSWVAVAFALAIPLSASPGVVGRVGDQGGAGPGRAVLYAAVGVALLWATQPWRRAGRRRPWCFVVAFLIALVAGGRIIAAGAEPAVGAFLAAGCLSTAYIVLAVEAAFTRPTWRR